MNQTELSIPMISKLPLLRHTLLALLLCSFAPSTALAIDPVNSNWRGIAISGADPVAYFTEGKHVEGSSDHTFEWMEASWHFANTENRTLFETNPEKYAPQFGGYCAYAVSQGSTAGVDPEAFTIVNDKLYLNYSKSIMKKWSAKRDEYIELANKNWPGIRDQ